jgi:hypothetical protein
MDQPMVSTPQTPPVSSFSSRAVDVFAAPSAVFSELAQTPTQTSSWMVPYVLTLIVGVLFTFALFSNPVLMHQVLQPSIDAIQQRVAEGKMTQDQADQAMSMMGGKTFLIFGSIGAVVMVSVAVFGIPLVLMLAAKLFLKSGAGYKKLLEVYGLSLLIGIVGSIVTLLMIYAFDSMWARPALSVLVLDGFDQKNFSHNLLASLNIFTIWQTAVVGIGMAKVSGRPTSNGMTVVFGLWIVWVIVASSLGWVR